MTKFSYEDREEECVAFICLLEGDPDQPILVLKNMTGKQTFIYHYGDISTRDVDWEEDAIKKFYPGDSVTITF